MAEIVKCIDISHWQDFPNFEEVRAYGTIAMIHKSTEGCSYVDPNRAKNCSNALKAGIAVCTYHWLSPGGKNAEQMEFYLSTVDPVPGERMVIDYEQDGCELNDLLEAVEVLIHDPRELRVSVYSGHLLKEQLGDTYNQYLSENTDLWLAQYTTGEPSWSEETYPKYTLWQYSEEGTIPGIDDAYVDLNRFNGTDDQLLAWISAPGATIAKPIKPPRPPIGRPKKRKKPRVFHPRRPDL